MNHLFRAWLVLTLLFGALAPTFGVEPLHPALVNDTESDPSLTLTKAQISGPLANENLDESWDQSKQQEQFAPVQEPDQLFSETDADHNMALSGAPVAPQRPLIDSSLTYTWLAPISDFGISDVEAKSTLLIPVFYEGSPLRLAMGFATTFLDLPPGYDVANQLYGVQAEFRWLIALRENLAVDVGAGGGLFSDFGGSGVNGARATGRAILIKTVSDRLKLSAGFLYLGRENLLAIPVAGVVYTPQDDVKIELLIPRSRIARKMLYTGPREHWVYAGVELFGGNSWVVEQPGGGQDVVVYKDNRLIVGYETKLPNALNGRVEVGYVFGRNFSVDSNPTDLNPGGTTLLRVGLTY